MDLHLERRRGFSGRKGPLLLIIMDGIGIAPPGPGNALTTARTPNLDRLFAGRLYTQLQAHGTAVGLPTDQDMGNSEVGHNALGAGRVIAQGARLVNEALDSGRIFQSPVWREIEDRACSGGAVHFIGLLSDGNVHSHIDHLYRLVDRCACSGLSRVRVHALIDGRDVGQRSALDYVLPTEEKLERISREKGLDYAIASGGGRMKVTMDRYYADWDIVRRGWEAHVRGRGRPFRSASEAVRTFYQEDPEMTDQYMDAFVVVDGKGDPVGPIRDGDAVVLFNFRGDRAIEISEAFTKEEFEGFDRGPLPDVVYAGMMQYDGDTGMPPKFLVEPPVIERTVSEYLCSQGVRMFAVSETQKYGHVTYFWNGNRSGYIDPSLETYVEIPSDRIPFDQAPEMKAAEIKDRAVSMLRQGIYRFGRLNFANGDMVGHTGVMEAAVAAAETVDGCVGALLGVVEELEGIAVVTADHGNLEEMFTIDAKGGKKAKTSHTLNPVPFAIFDPGYAGEYVMADLERKGLSNVAATLLNLLGFEKPEEYDPSLVIFAGGH
ncbi:MAG: 2,3-bisphosphoglycerate-independent phosphoglycerate mutase [Desulfobacteraceae bacterium]